MHLAIRTDGGSEIGYGHLVRSNALAEEILDRGHNVSVVTARPVPAKSVFLESVEIIELQSRDDPEEVVDWLEATSIDAVFTDSYQADTEYQRKIQDQVPLAVLQDDNRHAICADLFINGNLYALEIDYQFVCKEPTTYLGTDYLLLRREVHKKAKAKPPWRKHPERAIVMMGGSDITNLMPGVIRAFDGLNLRVDAIVGPGFSSEQEKSVRDAAADVSANVTVSRNPDDLVERMFQADFAVSTSGSTTYELLALGTPIISIPVADNQEPIAGSLMENQLAIVLNRKAQKVNIEKTIQTYISESEMRKYHQKRGMKFVDGKGTRRVANGIENLAQ
jgi:UDP-2,4-diacetamido-2,4,6-trideoxy-beta-L-altropyranose hydrolase